MFDVREIVAELDEDALFADGWDEAVIGTTDSWCPGGQRTLRVVYDASRIVEIMITRDGMTYEEAVEFFDFNIAGAYVGERTPVFVWPVE